MSLDNLLPLNPEEADKLFDKSLDNETDISKQYDACMTRARTYKYFAQIDGIRENMNQRAEKYYKKAQEIKGK